MHAKHLQDCSKNEDVNPLMYFPSYKRGGKGKLERGKLLLEQKIVENMYPWPCIVHYTPHMYLL